MRAEDAGPSPPVGIGRLRPAGKAITPPPAADAM